MITQTYDPLFTSGLAPFAKFPLRKVCSKPDPVPSQLELAKMLSGFDPQSLYAHYLGDTISAVCGDIRLPTRLVRQLDGRRIDALIHHGKFVYIYSNFTDSPEASLNNGKTQQLPRKHGRVIPCGIVFEAYKWHDEFILACKS